MNQCFEIVEKDDTDVNMKEDLQNENNRGKNMEQGFIEVETMREEIEKEDTKWKRWTLNKLDGINGDDKASKIKKIIIERIAKLNMELIYFRNDLAKEIVYDGFGIRYDELGNDVLKIIFDMIPFFISYDVSRFIELIPKYEKVNDKYLVLPKDYWYESIFYK